MSLIKIMNYIKKVLKTYFRISKLVCTRQNCRKHCQVESEYWCPVYIESREY